MTSTDTQPIPGLTEELVRLDHLRFKQEIQQRIDELEGEDRHEQLMQIREWKRQAARRDSYDPWGARKFREAARVLRDMR